MGTVFYGSLRTGLHGKPFILWKLRTMRSDGGSPTASMNDPRLTPVGKWLRRFKLDELPTLWNLLRGDITIVGPRPDVPSEYDDLTEETRKIIWSVKPGLISPATLWNINEDETLKDEPDPHQAYLKKIKPYKIALNIWYVDNRSGWLDLKVIVASALKLLRLPVTFEVYPKELCPASTSGK